MRRRFLGSTLLGAVLVATGLIPMLAGAAHAQAVVPAGAWQAAEQESLAARAAGESRVFDSAEDAIRYLLSEEED